jgi:hypothetical protein
MASRRSITKKAGSESTPKCHGSGTLLMAIGFLSDLKEPSCAVSASSWRLVQEPRPTASMLTPASGSPATIRGCDGLIHRHHLRTFQFLPSFQRNITGSSEYSTVKAKQKQSVPVSFTNSDEMFFSFQCCGSGSGSGSVCFWASRIRILP